MSAALYADVHGKALSYAFLSQPPPHRRRPTQPPTQPLPSPPHHVEQVRQLSATFSATISSWAAHVQPGSPAPLTPCSPQRRSSVSSRRRLSLNLGHTISGGIAHGRVASSPFVITPTPTTASHKNFDFAAVGYNTIFVRLPNTPETPSPLLREKAMREQAIIEAKLREKERAKEQSKERKAKVMKKIKSLTNLKARSKVTVALPGSPTHTTATAPASKGKSKRSSTKPAQKKKAMYGALPPSLHNELALMQFADGGKMDSHIKRAMVGPDGAVGDVYRDGKGGLWWDREEEMEYRGLLVDSDSSDEAEDAPEATTWVQFRRDSAPQVEQTRSSEETLVAPDRSWTNKVVFERRESASTLSSQDSDLDPAYMMQADETPAYHDERVLDFDLRASEKAAATLKANNLASKRNGMLLSLPARPFRAAKHLRKPEFMADLQAFSVIPKSPRSPLSPCRFANSFAPRSKARRRPAPLKISPAMTKLKRVVAVSSPGLPPFPVIPVVDHCRLIKEGKEDFLLDSFQPEVSKFDDDSECDFIQHSEVKEAGLKKRRPSRLDLRGIFGTSSRRPGAF